MKSEDSKKRLGSFGEDMAARYLRQKGYKILERSYRFGKGEIDIIAEKGGTLVFVEVKTDVSGHFGNPLEWVDRRKQRQIGRVALSYLQKKGVVDKDCRFDVIAITLTRGKKQIEHIENAFWLEG